MRILFIDLSTKLKNIDELSNRARGGMITSLHQVSKALSQSHSKHFVDIIADIEEPDFFYENGPVRWFNPEAARDGCSMGEPYDSYDFLVCNRGIGDGWPQIKARRRILWTHDLPHNGFIPEPRNIRAFSRVVFMSKYAERVWRAFYPDIGKSVMIPNGVDKSIFCPPVRPKDLHKMIYFSAPNRGLKKLPFIFDAIRHRLAEFGSRYEETFSMTAYSNMAKLHPNEVEDHGDGFDLDYKEVGESDVQLHDPVPQFQLAEVLRSAGLMILPTAYPEICSNAILQSLACGTPVLTTGNLGSAGEWIRDGRNGALTDFQPHDYMIHTVEIVRKAVEILTDPEKHLGMILAASKTKILSWEEVGAKWLKMLNQCD